jgi:hypothetical protein
MRELCYVNVSNIRRKRRRTVGFRSEFGGKLRDGWVWMGGGIRGRGVAGNEQCLRKPRIALNLCAFTYGQRTHRTCLN